MAKKKPNWFKELRLPSLAIMHLKGDPQPGDPGLLTFR